MKNHQTEDLVAPIPVPKSVNVAMADIAVTMREHSLAMALAELLPGDLSGPWLP